MKKNDNYKGPLTGSDLEDFINKHSEYWKDVEDSVEYQRKLRDSGVAVNCDTCKYILPDQRCGHEQGCEGDYELWEQ